jgi:hypothetical protein
MCCSWCGVCFRASKRWSPNPDKRAPIHRAVATPARCNTPLCLKTKPNYTQSSASGVPSSRRSRSSCLLFASNATAGCALRMQNFQGPSATSPGVAIDGDVLQVSHVPGEPCHAPRVVEVAQRGRPRLRRPCRRGSPFSMFFEQIPGRSR